MSNDYFKSKGWLTNYAQSEDSRGVWQNYVKETEDRDARIMELVEVKRSEMDNFNTPDLDQGADSILRPGETLEDDFDVNFRKANAKGGIQQLVGNTDDGSRPGYRGKDRRIPLDKKNLDKANLKNLDDSVNDLYTKYGKEYVDNAAKGWAKKSNLEKNRIKKITNTDLPLNEMADQVDRSTFKVKFKKDMAEFGEWDPDRRSKKNIKNKLYPASSTSNKMSFRSRIFDALGRKDSPNYDLPKLKAMQKNFAEYDVLKKYLNKNFGIATALDHPLDKATIETIMNASSKDLINVNILEQNLNTSFKKTLNNKYRQAMLDGNLDQKRAVETIAKKFNLNIGSVPDNQFKAKQVGPFELNKIDKGVGSFDKLNIKKEMLKSLENASKLDTEWGNYIKDNSDVFKTAGINTKKLKKPKNVANITKSLPEIEKYLNSTVTEFGSKSKKGKAAIQALAIIAGSTGAAVTDDGSEGTGGMLKDAAIAGGAVGTVGTKTGRKLLGNLFNAAGLPASLAFNYFAGIDPKSSLDRTILGAELATAPSTLAAAKSVTDKIPNKLLQKVAQVATGSTPFFLKAARIAQPVGIATVGGELVNKVIKESEPNYYIDPQTQEPTFYDRENAADVFPSMIDANEQAYKIAKERGISYEDAVKEIDYTRFKNLKND